MLKSYKSSSLHDTDDRHPRWRPPPAKPGPSGGPVGPHTLWVHGPRGTRVNKTERGKGGRRGGGGGGVTQGVVRLGRGSASACSMGGEPRVTPRRPGPRRSKPGAGRTRDRPGEMACPSLPRALYRRAPPVD